MHGTSRPRGVNKNTEKFLTAGGITKAEKNLKSLYLKDIKLLVKTRNIHKIEIKNSIGITFLGYEIKEKNSVYLSVKCCEEGHIDL